MNMRTILAIIACLSASLTANAQTWKLTELSDGAFAQGGDEQWSFEKFTYQTGSYTSFTMFGGHSTVNYVDIYQPERVGGIRVQDISGVVPNGEYTWANNTRQAWYDTEWNDEEPTRTHANEKFVYVSRLAELDNAFEVCGNKQYTPSISFWVPADGFYKVEGSIIRQDGANLKAIHVVPRFRYQGEETIDPDVTMGWAFAFGEGGTQLPDAKNTSLADGAEQRYSAQEASAFTFAFKAKKGDVVSFEVSYQNLATSTWPREYYPRAFYRELNIEQVSESAACAVENYIDPYDDTILNTVFELVDAYSEALSDLPYGTTSGTVPFDKWEDFDELLFGYVEMLENGVINALNARTYLERLESAWKELMASMKTFDLDLEGNYGLFSYTGSTKDETLEVKGNEEMMAENADQPWGFYGHVVSSGAFERLGNHDSNNLSNKTAWYRGSNQWYYITDSGMMHPLNDRAPGIMFTALNDGIYHLDLTLYRPNPNPGVENPLYVHWYHMLSGEETAATSDAMLSVQYGSVANDGEGGKKPVSTAFYVNMKKGDRVFFEIDSYTSGRNSSAGTQILSLSACSRVSEEEYVSLEMAQNSGQLFINPYGSGDCTTLKGIVAEAEELLATTEPGDAPGQYSEEARNELGLVLADARDMIKDEGDPTLTQNDVDEMTKTLQKAIDAYKETCVPYSMQPQGDFAIQLAGTDKYVTKKNQASGNYYYAAVDNFDAILADMQKNNTGIEAYSWTFKITPVEGSTSVTITTEDGYMTADGYIQILSEEERETIELPQFTLVRETPEASVFAIRRNSDGRYWTATMVWKSPYNRIETSSTPRYIWTLSNDTIPSIDPVEPTMDALKAAVAEAEVLLDTTEAGDEPGQYPEEARSTFALLVSEARDILKDEGDPSLTQKIIDEFVKIVKEGIETYKQARIFYTLQPEGDFAIQLNGTDKFLTKKNQAGGNYCYAAVNNYAAILSDIQKSSTTIDDYSWTFTITPVEGSSNITITHKDGYMTPDGYIQLLQEEGISTVILPEFSFVKENADDTAFAIRRISDGRFWAATMTWKSPYDCIDTSSTPLYIWTLSSATVTGVQDMEIKANDRLIYDLSGRRVQKPTKGLYIVNGKKIAIK